MELELAAMEPDEAAELARDLELGDVRGADAVVAAGYRLLELVTFFTGSGPPEARAWPVRRGTNAAEAAGKIHSDMERGFIRAEVIAWDDLVAAGSFSRARESAQVRMEGRTTSSRRATSCRSASTCDGADAGPLAATRAGDADDQPTAPAHRGRADRRSLRGCRLVPVRWPLAERAKIQAPPPYHPTRGSPCRWVFGGPAAPKAVTDVRIRIRQDPDGVWPAPCF